MLLPTYLEMSSSFSVANYITDKLWGSTENNALFACLCICVHVDRDRENGRKQAHFA